MDASPLAPLWKLADAWREDVQWPRRRYYATVVGLVAMGSLLLARQGTMPARGGAVLLLLAVMVAVGVRSRVLSRRLKNPHATLQWLASPVDAEASSRVLRAMSLLDRKDLGASESLSQLHVARSLEALPWDALRERSQTVARRYGQGAFWGACLWIGVLAATGWWTLEGFDILLARDGVAPLAISWLENVDIHARPPSYLHMEERTFLNRSAVALPRGTVLTLRGRPLHPGRNLALSDGVHEIPFVEDGTEGFVARWTLMDTAPLRIVARFGDVVIEEPVVQEFTAIEDELPAVRLDGAPKAISLAQLEGGSDIPIRYEALDDHGLREVDLVLQCGVREERRVLSRLDGETKFDRGGYVLRARDPFVRRSHAPVSVRVEAKDNDTVMGPKWGTSEVITLLPPEVGEPEALRVEALRRLRDVVVDSLAKRMDVAIPESADERKALLRDEALGVEADESKLESTITETHAGVRLAPRLSAMLRAAMRKVKDALGAEQKNFSVVTHEGLVRASERMVLVTDAVLRGLGVKDAREAARQLVDAADDLALGASQAQRPKEKDRSSARMDAATAVLEGGGRSLRRLGALGRDLGEIVAADLERVGRARFGATYQRGQEIPKGDGGITLEALDADWMHAELAARDLAARLRKPDPSFGARGGSSGRGGSEAGGGSGGASDEDDEMDDAERAFNEAAQEVSRLAQDHAAQMGNVDNALNRGQSDEDRQQFAKEAKERAEAVRQAVRSLPSLGEGSDSWTSKGATAKEHADSMARSLDNGNAQEAAASGRNALNDLEEAKRLAARGRSSAFGGRPDSDASRRITEAQKALEPQVAWAEQSLESLRKRAAERSASELRELAAQEEGLADRAHELMEKGRNEGTLPAPAADALEGAESRAREAGKSLKRGEAEQASEQQREAQRMLEMAREAMGTAEGDRRGGDDDSANADAHADIPKADAHRGPEEFRRRVVRGLGQPGTGRLKESIRRYAEGLLK